MKLSITLALLILISSCNNNGGKRTQQPKAGTAYEIIAVVTSKSGSKDAKLVTMAFVEDSLGKIDTQYYDKTFITKPLLDSVNYLPIKDSSGKIKTYQEPIYNRLGKDSVNPRIEFKNFAELTKINK